VADGVLVLRPLEQAKATEESLPVVRGQLRLPEGRDPEPSAGLIDSQTVRGADTVGRDSRGYDAGKKINGRKRFIVTDTLWLLLSWSWPPHAAHPAQTCRATRVRRDIPRWVVEICLMRAFTGVHRKVSEVWDAMRVSFCGLRT
jgi:Transposase DDE domain